MQLLLDPIAHLLLVRPLPLTRPQTWVLHCIAPRIRRRRRIPRVVAYTGEPALGFGWLGFGGGVVRVGCCSGSGGGRGRGARGGGTRGSCDIGCRGS